jgi:hypothetical protein
MIFYIKLKIHSKLVVQFSIDCILMKLFELSLRSKNLYKLLNLLRFSFSVFNTINIFKYSLFSLTIKAIITY